MSEVVLGKAVIPEPVTVLGLRLRPFSLGHFMLMRSLECGFAGDNEQNEVGINDLIIGVAICSHIYEEFLNMLDTGELQTWLESWGEQVEQQIKDDTSFNPVERFALFANYMKQGLQVPLYWEETDTDSQSGTHWSHNILAILVSECGYSRSEALNAPLSQTLADYFSFAERAGVIRLMSKEELEQVQSNGN